METIKLASIPRTYAISGQHAEQVARYTLTGKIEKADNKPFTAGGDCGDLQIKSARATVCKATLFHPVRSDIAHHISIDGAKRYGYVTADFSIMYIMTPAEYLDFADTFGTVTRDSKKNGGAVKIRLKSEGREMREWLQARA